MLSPKLTKKQIDSLYGLLERAASESADKSADKSADPISWATAIVENAIRQGGQDKSIKSIKEEFRRFFTGDRKALTPTVSSYIGIALSMTTEQVLELAKISPIGDGNCPLPSFRVVSYSELLAAGRDKEEIWDACDSIDRAIAREESSLFGERHWLDLDVCMAIAARDDWSMLCLVDSTGRIWGYTLMAALLPEYFERALTGDYYEPHVRLEHTVPICPHSDPLNIFVFGIDAHPVMWKDSNAANILGTYRLIYRLFDFLKNIQRSNNYRVSQIGALAVTETGRDLCDTASMTKIHSFERDGVTNDVYRLIPNPIPE
tara:strand:+ start:433 stop:1386 length:954 start_codon:yes stop_codon:yes gene_type:complete